MKTISLCLGLLFFLVPGLFSQDLPSPPAHIQLLPSGSYVIPMDNTLQLDASSLFNLKAYGLVVYLIDNGVKIKWVMRSGKLKDGIDFTATVQQVKPSLIAGTASAGFKAGPFVIYAADLSGVDALIDAYYIATSLTGNDRPKVYKTMTLVAVDVRYDLTGFLPKAAILTDGGNQAIHLAFMVAAGIPSLNYTTSTGSNLTSGCFTFASEPHNSKTGAAVDATITNIKNFVLAGGNFLAECAAVPNYENNALGRFQTTTGITVSNAAIGTAITYPNPDLSYSQFEGVYNASLTGSVKNWQISGSGINNEHNHATGSGASSSSIGASVSKLKSGLGGLVFYLGNHNFSTADIQNINGIRMYMNALLTPALTICGSLLPLKLTVLSGIVQRGSTRLQWTVIENETGNSYEIEKSNDGSRYSFAAAIINTGEAGTASYFYNDASPLYTIAYYRLKIISKNGNVFYSNTLTVKSTNYKFSDEVIILQNPFAEAIDFSLNAVQAGSRELSLYNVSGQKVFSQKTNADRGMNTYSLASGQQIPAGIYFLQVSGAGESIVKRLVKR